MSAGRAPGSPRTGRGAARAPTAPKSPDAVRASATTLLTPQLDLGLLVEDLQPPLAQLLLRRPTGDSNQPALTTTAWPLSVEAHDDNRKEVAERGVGNHRESIGQIDAQRADRGTAEGQLGGGRLIGAFLSPTQPSRVGSRRSSGRREDLVTDRSVDGRVLDQG
jgi:hypothetical protein